MKSFEPLLLIYSKLTVKRLTRFFECAKRIIHTSRHRGSDYQELHAVGLGSCMSLAALIP